MGETKGVQLRKKLPKACFYYEEQPKDCKKVDYERTFSVRTYSFYIKVVEFGVELLNEALCGYSDWERFRVPPLFKKILSLN